MRAGLRRYHLILSGGKKQGGGKHWTTSGCSSRERAGGGKKGICRSTNREDVIFFEQIQGSRLERPAYEEEAVLEKGDGRRKGDWTINFPLPTLSERCASVSVGVSRCRLSEAPGTLSMFPF